MIPEYVEQWFLNMLDNDSKIYAYQEAEYVGQ